MRELTTFWVVVFLVVIFGAWAGNAFSHDSEDVCAGVEIVDMRMMGDEAWVSVTTLGHIVFEDSDPVHFVVGPKWYRLADVEAQCGKL